MSPPARRRGQLYVLAAATLWATAGLGQRALDATAATQVAGRAGFAALTLLVLVLLSERRNVLRAFATMGLTGAVYVVLMAVSSGAFLLALNYTSVATVLFLLASSPVLAAALGWLLLGDRVQPRTWIAIAIATLGVAVMVGGSIDAGFLGIALPLLVTAAFAGTIVIARHRREISMLPATCGSQLLVVACAAPFASFGAVGADDWIVLGLLGTVQMGIALALFTLGARAVPPAETALLALIEVVLGPLLVWAAYSERPALTTLAGGAIVLVAVTFQTLDSARAARQTTEVHPTGTV